MSSEPTHNPSISAPQTATLADIAAMDNFVRLQKSQAEYLAWLEACEKKPEIDRYVYRKIR